MGSLVLEDIDEDSINEETLFDLTRNREGRFFDWVFVCEPTIKFDYPISLQSFFFRCINWYQTRRLSWIMQTFSGFVDDESYEAIYDESYEKEEIIPDQLSNPIFNGSDVEEGEKEEDVKIALTSTINQADGVHEVEF